MSQGKVEDQILKAAELALHQDVAPLAGVSVARNLGFPSCVRQTGGIQNRSQSLHYMFMTTLPSLRGALGTRRAVVARLILELPTKLARRRTLVERQVQRQAYPALKKMLGKELPLSYWYGHEEGQGIV
jgi:hypothetical protein